MASAAPASVAVEIKFTHAVAVDYADPTATAALVEDPWVHLDGGGGHPLVKAAPFAAWAVSPPIAPSSVSASKCIQQSVLDCWCLMGGIVTSPFKAHGNVLLRSIRADRHLISFELISLLAIWIYRASTRNARGIPRWLLQLEPASLMREHS